VERDQSTKNKGQNEPNEGGRDETPMTKENKLKELGG
jgi:hypothetical protein